MNYSEARKIVDEIIDGKKKVKVDGYREETRIFPDKGDLKLYLWRELYGNNPIIVTGIWEV